MHNKDDGSGALASPFVVARKGTVSKCCGSINTAIRALARENDVTSVSLSLVEIQAQRLLIDRRLCGSLMTSSYDMLG
jgi:hypothetical protein